MKVYIIKLINFPQQYLRKNHKKMKISEYIFLLTLWVLLLQSHTSNSSNQQIDLGSLKLGCKLEGNSCESASQMIQPNEIQVLNKAFHEIISNFKNINYTHNEHAYQNLHSILQFIKRASTIDFASDEEILIFLGCTGWGKSCTINLLDGVQFYVKEDGTLVPVDQSLVKTSVGNGSGSTTFYPVQIDTKFGKILDLPGDGQTRGIVPELINQLSKKQLGAKLSKVKIVFVVPASVFTSQGSYGNQFKKTLASIDKYVGGIEKFKNNMMMLITFSDRWDSSYSSIVKNIKNCLHHADGALKGYENLVQSLVNNERIKLIAKPERNYGLYAVPDSKEWSSFSLQNIVKDLKNLQSQPCKSQDFSVPYNVNLIPDLILVQKILIQKAKNVFQLTFPSKISLSGAELSSAEDFFSGIRSYKHLTIQQFYEKWTKYQYFNFIQIQTIVKELQMINEFIALSGKQKEPILGDWISESLDKKINLILNEIKQVKAEPKLNFRKMSNLNSLVVKPNSNHSPELCKLFDQLETFRNKKASIQLASKDQTSEFFDEVFEKVFDKTIEYPQEVEEQYVENQKQNKLHKVIKQIWEDVPVQKQRLQYRTEVEIYTQQVPRTRKVPRQQTQQRVYEGGRRYGLFGPRERRVQTITRTVEVDQVYYLTQQRSRNIQVPYTQKYTENEKRSRLIEVDQWRVQQVPVQKTRKAVIMKSKDLYRDQAKKQLNQIKLQGALKSIEQQIETKRNQITTLIESDTLYNSSLAIQVPEKNCRNNFEKNEMQLLSKWAKLEYNILMKTHPHRLPGKQNQNMTAQ